MPLFRFKGVTVAGEPRPPLREVTVDVEEGGVTAVAGPSGSGKTTFLRLCNRLEVPTDGRVLFRGDDVAHLDPLAHRRRVGMVFQRPTLFRGTVADNLRAADAVLDAEGVAAALEHVGLPPEFADRPAADLSGGEGQRVCIARALVAEPEVLLMDEPTSALDEQPKRTLETLTRRLSEEGMTVLWVTHDEAQLARIADRVIRLEEGCLAC